MAIYYDLLTASSIDLFKHLQVNEKQCCVMASSFQQYIAGLTVANVDIIKLNIMLYLQVH